MLSGELQGFILSTLEWLSLLFIFVVGLLILFVIVIYIRDVTQTKQAIRRNYPVIGRLRYLFERLGEFFRQYFFAMDREELPFNRAQRSWVYRAAKDAINTVAFGSTRDLTSRGTIMFMHCPFPVLEKEKVTANDIMIGPDCQTPFVTSALFNISGMSYGAISRPAVLALSSGAHLAGCWMNTGEGGLSPYHLEGGAEIVFQIGTAKYGVRDLAGKLDLERLAEIARNVQVRMFEIKLSQGAKPGKGGILPAVKVTEEIAHIRGIKVGTASISPNRHEDIKNIDELLDMVHTVRRTTGKPVGFKMALGTTDWLEVFCQAINKRGIESAPDFITVDGAEGGSGAAPMSLIDCVGLPLHESLPLLIDTLVAYGLRDRIRVVASGKLITPVDVAWALCMGADFITSARGFMFALGCIQALQCNKNTCPTGITTHNPHLQKGLDPAFKAHRVAHYVKNMLHEVGVIAHSCGVEEPRQLQRHHARMVISDGDSVLLSELYPGLQPPTAHGETGRHDRSHK
jgi:glutamate synthase domain-containing protein 2